MVCESCSKLGDMGACLWGLGRFAAEYGVLCRTEMIFFVLRFEVFG